MIASSQKAGGWMSLYKFSLAQQSLERVGGGVGRQYTPSATHAQTYQMSHGGTKTQAQLITT